MLATPRELALAVARLGSVYVISNITLAAQVRPRWRAAALLVVRAGGCESVGVGPSKAPQNST